MMRLNRPGSSITVSRIDGAEVGLPSSREERSMKRPIGVTLLALGAGLAGLYQVWRILVFLGVANWTFIGKEVSFPDPQWGQAFWALILAAIWFWIAEGFWNVRAYAWTFGSFIALFTLIWGFFAVLFGSSIEAETIPWLLAGVIYFYLNYPGVRNHFVESEMSRLTPEQKQAMEQLAAANAAAAQAMAAKAPTPPPPAPPAS
jgi:tetrahydromethanopterin S-methyltransferase subunit C